jgi:hypothetical protein
MKKFVLTAIVVFLVLSVKAQSELSVEYVADEYQTAVEKQNNPQTSALRTTWVANTPKSILSSVCI